jgi:hypothetical protein
MSLKVMLFLVHLERGGGQGKTTSKTGNSIAYVIFRIDEPKLKCKSFTRGERKKHYSKRGEKSENGSGLIQERDNVRKENVNIYLKLIIGGLGREFSHWFREVHNTQASFPRQEKILKQYEQTVIQKT